MTTAEALARPRPPADARLAYADHPSGFGDLRLPSGEGPFPVVVLVHGGCWLAEYDLGYMAGLAAALTAEGYATWTIEYRRVGEEGGGWPGTFADVAAAADQLRVLARSYPLDTGRVVAVGHSAGGHLALWLASRRGIVDGHRLNGAVSDGLRGVVGLAPITDLAEFAADEGSCNEAVPLLLGDEPSRYAERLALASPDRLMPPEVPVHLVHGRDDAIVPLSQTVVYVNNVNRSGGSARETLIEDAGHFDLIAPFTEAWEEAREVIVTLLQAEPGAGG
jgi:acetyl esterase/lipase